MEKKTSAEWQLQYPETKVLDPDGWDRNNFIHSWFREEIDYEEYTRRLRLSTVSGTVPLLPEPPVF